MGCWMGRDALQDVDEVGGARAIARKANVSVGVVAKYTATSRKRARRA